MDVVEQRDFYRGPLGRATAMAIARALAPVLRPAKDQTVLGLGYATPILDIALHEDVKALAFMLARQGVVGWPLQGDIRSALVDTYDLPLLESTLDYILVVHGLELADSPLEMLQELWRVMAPQGKLILVVPNRRGLWAAADTSPFGQGQPFSRRQVTSLLKEAQFAIHSLRPALFMPPVRGSALLRAAHWLDKAGPYVMPRFSGVTIIEAVKQVYAFTPGKRVRRFTPRLRPALLPAPQGARFSTPLGTRFETAHRQALQNHGTLPMKAPPN